jgi:hypothetical protein
MFYGLLHWLFLFSDYAVCPLLLSHRIAFWQQFFMKHFLFSVMYLLPMLEGRLVFLPITFIFHFLCFSAAGTHKKIDDVLFRYIG